jgi:hypothetical protein
MSRKEQEYKKSKYVSGFLIQRKSYRNSTWLSAITDSVRNSKLFPLLSWVSACLNWIIFSPTLSCKVVLMRYMYSILVKLIDLNKDMFYNILS